MVRVFYLFLFFFSFFNVSLAQPFVEAYEAGKYKKCLKKADREIRKGEHKLLARLYKSMSYAQLASNPTFKESRAAEKAAFTLFLLSKRDHSGNFMKENAEKVQKLNILLLQIVQQDFDKEKYKKVETVCEKAYEATKEPAFLYWQAQCLLKEGEQVAAMHLLNKAAKSIYIQYQSQKLTDPYLQEAFIQFAGLLTEGSDFNEAFIVLWRSQEVFGDSEEVRANILKTLKEQSEELSYHTPEDGFLTHFKQIKVAQEEWPGDIGIVQLKWKSYLTYIESLLHYGKEGRLSTVTDSFITQIPSAQIDFEKELASKLLVDKIKEYYKKSLGNNYFIPPNKNDTKNWKALAEIFWKLKLDSKSAITAGIIKREGWMTAVLLHFTETKHQKLPNEIIVAIRSSIKDNVRLFQNKVNLDGSKWMFPQDLALEELHRTFYVHQAEQMLKKKNFSDCGSLLRDARQFYPEDDKFLQLNKRWVIEDYRQNYLGSEVDHDSQIWNGNVNSCDPGTVEPEVLKKVLQRLNYYRRLAGVPDQCELDSQYNYYAQAATLLMHANNDLDHHPPSSWKCYSADGSKGAGNSNLSLGAHSVYGLKNQMEDYGAGNYFIGHRRWILFPFRKSFGVGSTDNFMSLYCLGGSGSIYPVSITARYKDQPVMWPPADYTPEDMIFSRWSFSLRGADFQNANVEVWANGQKIKVGINKVENGYGDNTLVFEPDIPWVHDKEVTYTVLISDFKRNYGGEYVSYQYQVIVLPDAVF